MPLWTPAATEGVAQGEQRHRREFNVVRHQEGKGNSVTSIELRGFNKNPKQAIISARVRKAHKGKPCVFHPVAFPSG